MSDDYSAVSFGEALVDFFPAQEGAYGTPLRDIDVFRRYCGGAPTNTAIGLARLGVPTSLVTCFANDEMGEYLIKTLRQEGVELLSSRTDVGPTSLAFIGWDEKGDRRFAFYRRSGADEHIEPRVVQGQCRADPRSDGPGVLHQHPHPGSHGRCPSSGVGHRR